MSVDVDVDVDVDGGGTLLSTPGVGASTGAGVRRTFDPWPSSLTSSATTSLTVLGTRLRPCSHRWPDPVTSSRRSAQRTVSKVLGV